METHTFHFPHGEATITLQDVALQLGLKIDGLPVTGFITDNQLPVDADDVVIAQHARAHMMMIIGGCLMSDTSVLTSLFRALDRAVKPDQTEIGGSLLLLQSWACDRIKCITPKIDHLSMEEFLWTPYDTPEIRSLINDVEVSMIVRAKVPPICFAIVEWHLIDRVMRQFGLRQIIPDDPPNLDQIHDIDMRGRTDIFCPHHHRQWILKWNHWNNYIVHGEMDQVPSTSNVFYGSSQMFATTFNTPPSAYNLAPSSSCYRPSLPTQIHDMSHEDEDEDEDNNNNNDDNDDGDGVDDDDNSGHHVPQQQWTITRQHPRTRAGRGRRPRGQQTQTNLVQQDEKPRRISRKTRCGTSSHY
ncbi:Serine/threonine-protein phosphatase 7 long form [Glycine max]|nr:Serine/threonine-protein phosphatase 7 long form [Glycine max]